MDFWQAYVKKRAWSSFGQGSFVIGTADRHNVSARRIEPKSSLLTPSGAVMRDYSEERRYLIIKDLTFDLFVSFYDVNSKALLAMRISYPITDKEVGKIKSILGKKKRAKWEMRTIGLQDGDIGLVSSIAKLRDIRDCELVDVELFGNQTRHLVVDMLTGVPYNLLLLNRIYRPGELNNNLSKDDFFKSKSELKFV